MPDVASFGVFDTVLTRTVGSADHVFDEIGRVLNDRGVLTSGAAVYAAARRAAQQDRTADDAEHPRLAELAVDVAFRLGLPPSAAAALEAAELDVERAVCRAVPGAVRRVTAARTRTRRGVVFVSDTPLPGCFLEELLVREGLFRPGDELFVSAEIGASKQDGRLFDVVAHRIGGRPADFRHTDDRWADAGHAADRGWRLALDRSAHLRDRELMLAADPTGVGGLGPRLAAAARTTRLRAAQEGVDAGTAAVAGTVALPLLVGFARWVLRQAELQGLDRLYFVARDGELLREVTRRVAGEGSGVELRYLHGSRRSWELAASGRPGHDPVRQLRVPDDLGPADLTPRELLHLVDLTPEDTVEQGLAAEFDDLRVDGPMGPAGWARMHGLLDGTALAATARRRAVERHDLLLAYLDQEGVTGAGRVGLVDVGWTGRAARSLEDLLRAADRRLPAAHLYVGVLASAPSVMGEDLLARTTGWLMDEPRGRVARSGPGEDPVMLVETLAMGREGTTLGFAVDADRVVPVLSAAENPAAARWPLEDYRRALDWALDAFLDGAPVSAEVDLRPLAWAQLLEFWRTPTTAEARVWGAQPYGEDFANLRSHPLARPVTMRRLLARLGLGRPGWREPTYWLAGSARLSAVPIRWALGAVMWSAQVSARAAESPRRSWPSRVRRGRGDDG